MASKVTVEKDNRVRLLSALLAMTTWPEQEQGFKPHGVHIHARHTREFLAEAEYHPAVITMQELLERGLTLDTIFSYAAALSWPELWISRDAPEWAPKDWHTQMQDFVQKTRITELWDRDDAAWNSAVAEAERALQPGDPVGALSRYFGALDVELVFLPNLSYPSSETIGFRDGKRLVAIDPPPIAWGTNPPWPYDDNPGDTPRDAFSTYSRILLHELMDANPDQTAAARKIQLPIPNAFRARHPDWFEQFAVLFVSGVTANYLRETFGDVEAKSYIMMVQKANGFDVLPSVLDVMQNYLEGHAAGKHSTFADYLPTFIKSLRVAENIKKM